MSSIQLVYFVSGLGADQRAFGNLKLPGVEVRHIHWIDPLPAESLTSYAQRLIHQIDTRQEVILVGLSFGGIIAQEIARLLPCKKIVLISSVKSRTELPWPLRLVGTTNLLQAVPPMLMRWVATRMANFFFGVKGAEASRLLRQIMSDTNSRFAKWAALQLVRWKQSELHPNLVHIHGTADRIFPFALIKGAMGVQNGGHFMVVDKAEALSKLLLQALHSK